MRALRAGCVLLAFLLTSTAAVAQWATPELKQAYEARQPPAPPPQSNFEREAEAYAKATRDHPDLWGDPQYGAILRGYWQQRLEIAGKLDRGEISVTAAAALNDAARIQGLATMKNIGDRAMAEYARLLAQQQAAQAAADDQRRQEAIAAGLRLLTTPPQAPGPRICSTRWFAGRWVTTCP